MKLTDALIRQSKPSGKLVKLSDGHGLQLWVAPSGAKSWHVASRVDGRQVSKTLGHYPAMSLKAARAAAAELRERPRARSLTFGAVKAEWIAKMERDGLAGETLARAGRMDRYSAPLDSRPISEVRPPDLLDIIRPLEQAGKLETARRLRAAMSQIFRFGAALGLVDADPAALLHGAIAAPRARHRAAFVDREGLSRLLSAIDAYEGRRAVREAMLLMAYTAARPGEVRLATWDEFDLEAGVWSIPAGRMKMRQPHRAPLAPQPLSILLNLRPAVQSAFLFPSDRPGRPLSENAFNAALRSMGFGKEEVSAHGFRSSFSTIANESGLWSPDAIERALAHQDANAVRRAYHRADYWEERRRMMLWWAGELDRMRGTFDRPTPPARRDE